MKRRWAWMRTTLFLGVGLAIGACTTPNPRSCADGNCTDPAYPYCDADGSLAGTPKSCIAVDCTPGEVAQCQGSEALTCNSLGGDYDLVHCEHGCDVAVGGCRLCEPNQTACTNGKVATCDASGTPTVAETCALGCYENEPRCRDIVPSNGLASLLDTPQVSDVTLVDATINSATGAVTTAGGPVIVPTTVVDNGRLRVFIARNLTLRNVTLTSTGQSENASGPAVAFVARGAISVEGRIRVLGGAGGEVDAQCIGGDGYYTEDDSIQNMIFSLSSGSGGGGNATAGGRGGNPGASSYIGGRGGGVIGNDALVPLRGGCASGGVFVAGTGTLPIGSPGGGALQLTSRVSIEVTGTIDARGAHGITERVGQYSNAYYGGGGGGSILLEAPTVTLKAGSKVIAKGGGGGAEGGPPTGDDTPNPDVGTLCTSAGTFICSGGGNGATTGVAATNGGDTATTSDGTSTGGGGGGLGRIRINTRTGTYAKDTSAVEAGSLTTAAIQTR